MDPATAFSLAGTVLQFIETGSKFVILAWRLYRPSPDSANDFAEASQVTSALSQILEELSHEEDAGETNENGDGCIARLANDCRSVASQLLNVLQSIKLPENGKIRKRDALKAAFRLLWNEDEVKALQSRLEVFRSQLNLHLLHTLRHYASRSQEQQEAILQKLGLVHEEAMSVREAANSILRFVASKGDGDDMMHGNMVVLKALHDGLITAICQTSQEARVGAMPGLQLSKNDLERTRSRILASLRYQGMTSRESRIAEAYESTFKWVLDDHQVQVRRWSSFREWLESDDQLYWITGKAGSGKSTLMKFLCDPGTNLDMQDAPADSHLRQRSRCYSSLKKWAGTSTLIVVSFYFWNSGVELQMTQLGLLLSLLYQILSQCPDIIPVVLPKRWECLGLLDHDPGPWNEPELRRMLHVAAEILATDSKLCLFVDGLDEFDGDHENLITLFRDLVQANRHVKVCVASRPWIVFQDAFEHRPNLRLEDLTYDDIKHYVSSRLLEDPEFAKLRQKDLVFADQLLENIVVKASGVFLWVNLVVTSLIAGMGYGDRISDLQKRLDFLPPDLESLYEKMLQSLDPFYLEHAAQFFLLVESAEKPLSILQFSFADEESPKSAIKMPIGAINEDSLVLRLDAMSRRLNSRCKGLLEIERLLIEVDTSHQSVQYLHRTVRDFIKSAKVQQFLQSCLKCDFDPHMRLCVAYLMCTKAFGRADGDMIRSCLRSAARIQEVNEKDVLVLLDDLSWTLDATVPVTQENSAIEDITGISLVKTGYRIRSRKPNHNLYGEQPTSYLGQDWDLETQFGPFGETFISLAVIHGVVPYVKARATRRGLIQRPCYAFRTTVWPLLMDAFSANAPNPAMVQCLLDLEADPNCKSEYLRGETPWSRAASRLFSFGKEMVAVRSWNELDKDWRHVLELMISSGADMSSILLPGSLHDDLGKLAPPNPKRQQSDGWFSFWGRTLGAMKSG